MDDRSAADESESAASSLQQTDLSCSVGLSNGGDECMRRVEEDGSHSLSPYFERRSRSLVLPANPASWSESGHAELTAAERSTHRQRRERESRSATLTKDRVDTAVHRQLVGSSQGGSSLDREVGGKAASPTTWRNEEDETVFLFDDERSVEATPRVNIDEFVIVNLTSSGSFGQVPPPPPPRRGSSGHIHQWWSVDSANGGGHTVMIYRSSSHEQLSSLASTEEVDSPHNGRGKPDLHSVKSVKRLTELLEHPEADPDGFNEAMDAPIHTYIRRQYKERAELLVTLFSNGAADMDLRDGDHLTPLHLTAQMNDFACVKVLVAVGADELAMNAHNQIPMDLAKNKLKELLMQLHSRPRFARCSSKESYVLQNPKKLGEQLRPDNIVLFALKLEDEVNRQMDTSADVTQDAVALIMQQREIKNWKKTMTREQLSRALYPQVLSGSGNLGSRILFLDGGGMRALVEIEILMDIERRTNHKITEMFDWIVGTSTGGIIALGLVYAQKSLLELKQLYLRLRSDTFGGGILKIMDKSAALDRILKKEFGTKIAMCDVEHPKVMICAADKSTTDLRVKFFNNFYDDSPELTNIPVWMAARAAAAAPTYFTSFMNCVDGGVKANNPSEYAMMEIHNHYRRRGRPLPEFKIIVSVGTGKFPPKDMGNTDLGLRDTILTPKHLFDLLINTISTSEEIALKFKAQCERENIPFFRFNPRFTQEIPPDEISVSRLVDMILHTKLYLVSVQCLDSAYQMTQIFSKLLQ